MNHVFIALGGTGYKVVSEVQKKLNLYNSANQKKSQNLYIYIDTDEDTLNKLEDDEETLKIDLGSYQMQSVNSALNKSTAERHFDFSGITIPNTILRDGAKAERQFSRVAFNYGPHIKMVQEKFNRILESDKSDNPWDNLNVWVISGSAGGTGSGIMMDALYALYRKYSSRYEGNFKVKSLVLLPNIFTSTSDQSLNDRYKRNGFAFLQELNAFVRYGANSSNSDVFHSFCPYKYDASGTHTNWQPLSACYLFDDYFKGGKFTIDEIYPTIALFLLSMTIGSEVNANATMDSIFTNSSFDHNKYYIDFFSSFGMHSVESSFQYFSAYANNQIARNLLRNIVGTGAAPRNEVLNTINASIEKFNAFNDTQDVLKMDTRWFSSEKKVFKKIAQEVDFINYKPLILSDEKSNALLNKIVLYRNNLNSFIESLKTELLELCKRLLHQDYGLEELLKDLAAADNMIYASYVNCKNTKEDEQTDYLGVLENKRNMYIYYMLAVGDPVRNDQGIIDKISAYYSSVKKDFFSLFVNITHDELKKTLNNIEKAKITDLLPDFSSIMPEQDLDNGIFARLLSDYKFDYSALSRNFLGSVYPLIEFKENVYKSGFSISRINELLLEFVSSTLENSEGYKQFRSKSIEQLIEDYADSFNDVAKKLKENKDIFMQERHILEEANTGTDNFKYAYVGNFTNQNLLNKLGFTEDMSNVKIDSPYFNDRIIKIVVKQKIQCDNYFQFESLKTEFDEGFTKPRAASKTVSTPFIHRDFAGKNFKGDIYTLLNDVRPGVVDEMQGLNFAKLDTDTKSLVFKYALLFLNEYISKTQANGYLKSNAQVSFSMDGSVLKFNKVEYDDFINKFTVNAAVHSIDMNSDINIPSNLKLVKDFLKYFKSVQNQSLSEQDEIFVHETSYTKLADRNIASFLKSFVDFSEKKILRDFVSYIENLNI